ncbi:MAG: PaaI family thioesterase [Alphaproteobacteria bacterium]|nr:PaaI family thioesterase [Alphaproteobacteria bacterium]
MPESVPEGFKPFPIAAGFELRFGPLYIDPTGARPRLGLQVAEHHLNPLGILHGGVVMALADEVIAVTLLAHVEGRSFATISLNCDFLAAGKPGEWVEAAAEVVRLTQSLAFMRATVASDTRALATASGMWRLFERR